MNIGLIVYSETGNTLSVIDRLRERLTQQGHSVRLDEVKTKGPARPGSPVELAQTPDVTGYDALVLASPVQAFSLAPAMQGYVTQLSSFKAKPVALLITQFFPFPWMGGRRALRQLSALCEARGARVLGGWVINWSRREREKAIRTAVLELGTLFPASSTD